MKEIKEEITMGEEENKQKETEAEAQEKEKEDKNTFDKKIYEEHKDKIQVHSSEDLDNKYRTKSRKDRYNVEDAMGVGAIDYQEKWKEVKRTPYAQSHTGHRDRMRTRLINCGFDMNTFAQHEVLEFLLYHVIPRKNTNDIAHQFIDKFGTIAEVLDADMMDLKNTGLLSDNAVIFLHSLPHIFSYYGKQKNNGLARVNLNNAEKLAAYIKPHIAFKPEEEIHILLMDFQYRLISDCKLISVGTTTASNLDLKKITGLCLRHRATYFAITHNHPYGDPNPSFEDIMSTRGLYEYMKEIGVLLVEHLIFTGNRFVSFAFDGLFKAFKEKVEPSRFHNYVFKQYFVSDLPDFNETEKKESAAKFDKLKSNAQTAKFFQEEKIEILSDKKNTPPKSEKGDGKGTKARAKPADDNIAKNAAKAEEPAPETAEAKSVEDEVWDEFLNFCKERGFKNINE